MKWKLTLSLILICLLAGGGALNSLAQEKKPRPDESRIQKTGQVELKVPPDGTFKMIAPKFAFSKVVKGAPYSATATTETIQTLSDGNQIIRKNESKLYRDSEGRTRTEQTLGTIGKWAADGEAQKSIFINDPVAGVSYSLDPQTHTAQKNLTPQKKLATNGARSDTVIINGQKVTTYSINDQIVTQAEFEAFAVAKKKREAPEDPLARKIKEPPNDQEFIINGQKLTQAEFEAAKEKKLRAQEESLTRMSKEAPGDSELEKKLKMLQSDKPAGKLAGKPDIEVGQKKAESLGTQTIEGVAAEGTRLTLTIPAGEIGNTLPLEIVDENWYSSELQVMVMTRHLDPRSGETTYRLTNLSRSELDRSLFEVPSDYTVMDNKLPTKTMKPLKEEQ